ncbi:MAG: twin-arginine translocation signal domain-containing protein, partial [Phycisphaerae bacterium]|nr:twin-arginine translocation signal domain-containing protein [Phycisphaerae bacterium]
MADKQRHKVNDVTRREFIRDGTFTAAGLAMGFGMMGSQIAQAGKARASVRKTRSYNPEMEYRRLGKTGLWVSAVCMGGHWKRVDKMVPGVFKGKGWLSAD